MSEYISREAAREKCCSLCRWDGTSNCEECEHPIDDIQAADVREVVREKWKKILQNNDGTSDYECSACAGLIIDVPDDDEHPLCRYCPNCGAEMRGAE